jgi:hypothetical protein
MRSDVAGDTSNAGSRAVRSSGGVFNSPSTFQGLGEHGARTRQPLSHGVGTKAEDLGGGRRLEALEHDQEEDLAVDLRHRGDRGLDLSFGLVGGCLVEGRRRRRDGAMGQSEEPFGV